MRNIYRISKRGIRAIIAFFLLLCIAGTCVNISVTPEENLVATEKITLSIEENTVATGETAVITEKTTPELIPMRAQGCCDNNYSDYDGMTFYSTSYGLNAMGIPFSGSGLGIVLLSPLLDIDFGQRGTDLCVFITDITTGRQLSWFKVKRW